MSKILAVLFSKLAEGDFGAKPKAAYWWLAGKKTWIGALFGAAWAALDRLDAGGVCAAQGWDCAGWSTTLGGIAAFMLSWGLYDGALRSPVPYKYAGLLLLALLPSYAGAATLSEPAYAIGSALAILGIAMLLWFALTRRPGDGGPWTLLGTVVGLGALAFTLSSCGYGMAQVQLGRAPLRSPDEKVVLSFVCRGEVEAARLYLDAPDFGWLGPGRVRYLTDAEDVKARCGCANKACEAK